MSGGSQQPPPVPASDGDQGTLEESDGDGAAYPAGMHAGAMSAEDQAAFRRFQQFLRLERRGVTSPRRTRRERGDDDDEDGFDGKGQSGPPPTWDGQTPFEDYQIRAKLWLATTKAKGKTRGPLLLKSLSGTPFETFKHYAKDSRWLASPDNADTLLEQMNLPEYFGDDQQEHMITALSRVTYHLKRAKGESWRDFFSRWDVALRKVHEHKISFPPEYEGFLLINGLQLSEGETKALLNFTRGCIRPVSIKEWLRKNETKLGAHELGSDKKKAANIMYAETEPIEDDAEDSEYEFDQETEAMEAYLTDLQAADDPLDKEFFEEEEAAEILATMIKQRKTYKESIREKKEKELSRGYGGFQRGKKGKGKGTGKFTGPVRPGLYRISVEELRKRTKCHNCLEVGHWKKECPHPPRTSDAHLLESFTETEEAIFVGHLEVELSASPEDVALSDSEDPVLILDQPKYESADFEISQIPEAYNVRERSGEFCDVIHELFMFENWMCRLLKQKQQHLAVDDYTCATLDTGCQRLAIGNVTLKDFAKKLPNTLTVTLRPEINRFKSVHNISTTKFVATVPSSLGTNGTFLRPAVFDESNSEHAPFLVSLTYLLHCRSTLGLDEDFGLYLRFRDDETVVPLHLGPTNALRVPLQSFTKNQVDKLSKVQKRLMLTKEFEVLNLSESPQTATQVQASNQPELRSEQSHGVLAEASAIPDHRPGTSGSVEKDDREADEIGDSSEPCVGEPFEAPIRQEEGHVQGDERDGHGGVDLHPGDCQHADPTN